jgi:lipopolysaccharide/colanic/teichoic acid biosynthesis glycosyltransferase
MTSRLRYSILFADLLWITTACMLAHLLRYGLSTNAARLAEPQYIYLMAAGTILAVWNILYFNKNLEGFSRGWHFPTICSHVIVGTLYLIGALLALGFFLKVDYWRPALLSLSLFLSVGFISIRGMAWGVVKSWSRMGTRRRAVIVGSGPVTHVLANKIARHPEMMIEVIGFFYPSDEGHSNDSRTTKQGMASVQTLDALELLQQKKVHELIVTEQLPPGSETEKLITSCHRAGMQVHLVPQWYELYLPKVRLTEIDDVPLVSLEARSLRPGALEMKRVLDITGALVAIVLAFPLMAVIWGELKRGKRTALKRELRCGRNGTQFWMYSFNVDRRAKDLVGLERFLACVSLTELPQLWNVVRGEMSLVGPRPESTERVKHYSVWQTQRLSAKPGLTGLAQVHGLREQNSSEEKANFDLQYIYHWSLFFDFSILLETAWTLTSRLLEMKRSDGQFASKLVAGARYPMREAQDVNSSKSSAD